jgi:hypothetical protein
MGRIIPYIMENKKCSKPPTRNNREKKQNETEGLNLLVLSRD